MRKFFFMIVASFCLMTVYSDEIESLIFERFEDSVVQVSQAFRSIYSGYLREWLFYY